MTNFLGYHSGSQTLRLIPKHWPSSQLKTLGGRLVKEDRQWEFPANISSIRRIQRFLGERNVELSKQVLYLLSLDHGFPVTPSPYLNLPKNVAEVLLPYQLKAINYLLSAPHGALLNIEPGLGKTLTTLSAASLLVEKTKGRILVICGVLSLLDTWKYEFETWFGGKFDVCHQKMPDRDSSWVVTNLHTARNHPEWFDCHWDAIIFDESIKLMNHHTQIWETMYGRRENKKKKVTALYGLRNRTDHLWLLSGSPTSKFYDDLFAQLRLLDPIAFSSYWRFVDDYCFTQQSNWGTQIVGSKTHIDIADEFRDYMLTITETQALGTSSLDKMRFDTIYVELAKPQRELFDTLKKELILQLLDEDVPVVSMLAQMTRLQQIVSDPANVGRTDIWSTKLAYLESLIDDSYVKLPAIIWTHWQKSADNIVLRLRDQRKYRVGRLIGGDDASAIQDFRDGKLDILVISLGVGKYGHTLSNAKSMVYYDKSFDADAYVQSIKRVSGGLRGLQNSGSVHVISLVSPRTTDVRIANSLGTKLESITQVNRTSIANWLRGLS